MEKPSLFASIELFEFPANSGVHYLRAVDFDGKEYTFQGDSEFYVFGAGKLIDRRWYRVDAGRAGGLGLIYYPEVNGKHEVDSGPVSIVCTASPEAIAKALRAGWPSTNAGETLHSGDIHAEFVRRLEEVYGDKKATGGPFRDFLTGLKESDLVKGTEARSDGGTLSDLKTEVDEKATEAAIKSLDRFVDVAIALKKWPNLVKLRYDVAQAWRDLVPTIAFFEGRVALPNETYRFTGVYGDKVETGPAHWPERIDVHKNGWGEAKEGDPSRGFFYIRQDLYDAIGNDFSECEETLHKTEALYGQALARAEVLERNQEPYRKMLETMCLSFACKYEIYPDGSYKLEEIFREGKPIDEETRRKDRIVDAVRLRKELTEELWREAFTIVNDRLAGWVVKHCEAKEKIEDLEAKLADLNGGRG